MIVELGAREVLHRKFNIPYGDMYSEKDDNGFTSRVHIKKSAVKEADRKEVEKYIPICLEVIWDE